MISTYAFNAVLPCINTATHLCIIGLNENSNSEFNTGIHLRDWSTEGLLLMYGLNKGTKTAHTSIVLDVSQIIAPIAYLFAKLILGSLSNISIAINYLATQKKKFTLIKKSQAPLT